MAAAAAAAHVLVFPAPGQGHINCMMHFATGLVGAGLHVTFLHTDHSLRRLGGAAAAGGADSPRLRFMSIPDGLPDDHPRAVGDIVELLESLRTNGSVPYRSLLASLVRAGDDGASSGGFPPVTCVVADGSMPFAADVAEEIGVPSLVFRTAARAAYWPTFDRLFELGEVVLFPADGDLDEPVRGVPGMESFLRRRDLPGNFRNCTEDQNDPIVQMLIEVTAHSRGARAVVLNTARVHGGASASRTSRRAMRDVFAIGPLPRPCSRLWRADDGCVAWLDGQAGPISRVREPRQLRRHLAGAVSRSSSTGSSPPATHSSGCSGRTWSGRVRAPAPSAKPSRRRRRTTRRASWGGRRSGTCLRHRAVGCFLTHAGWNSTLEAAGEGVPTVCWPFFADQQINSRFVGAVWGTGLDMKDVCDAAVVERMVREAMESGEIRASAQALARRVRQDVADGGSSAAEFERLVGFIKELSNQHDGQFIQA
ncbi:hypothetical protein DAI22_07g144450 [Oryza sativa Japonica Group]|nr:hypothetical protein DAI22_07g144450 [Oryza sativa Japonica Group]